MDTAKSIRRPVLPDPPPQPAPEGYLKPAENRSIVIVWLRTFAWMAGGCVAFLGGITFFFAVPGVLCEMAATRGDYWEAAGWALIPVFVFFSYFPTMEALSLRGEYRARREHDLENERRLKAGEWPLPRGYR